MSGNATSAGTAALVALALTLPLAAHEHATGVIRERMDAMKSMADAMKAITRRSKAGRDLALVGADAQRVRDLAEKIVGAFPPGSARHPSEAKPAIWKTWADFEAKARNLVVESDALARADAQDAGAIRAQAKRVAQSCSGCHEVYRLKR
jgi:cytochrome c556